MSLEIVTDAFLQETQTQYNLQQHNNFRTLSIRSVYHGPETISLGPKTWNSLLPNMKQSGSLNGYEKQLETRNLLLLTLQSLFRWCRFYKLKPQLISAFINTGIAEITFVSISVWFIWPFFIFIIITLLLKRCFSPFIVPYIVYLFT